MAKRWFLNLLDKVAKKAEKEKALTFLSKNKKSFSKSLSFSSVKGMTIIEIMMVIALIGMLISVGLPKFDQLTRANVRTSVRRLGALVKYCYDQAIISGKLHRIRVDLGGSYFDESSNKVEKEQKWTLEMAQGDALPEEQIKAELIEDVQAQEKRKQQELEKNESKTADAFVPAQDAKKHYLPRGIKIVSVKSWRIGDNKQITQGDLGIYCFPNGFIDEATITLQELNKPKSVLFHVKTRSLTGRVDIDAEAPPQ
jgi:prepilin-type N-terminal cleavage/methylation domain-containing protein